MLIDLFDAETKQPVGEYGFGGFKLYPKPLRTAERPQKKINCVSSVENALSGAERSNLFTFDNRSIDLSLEFDRAGGL